MLFTIKLNRADKASAVYVVPREIEAMWQEEAETVVLLNSGDSLSVKESPEAITKIVQKAEVIFKK